jgi:hypothetical protein
MLRRISKNNAEIGKVTQFFQRFRVFRKSCGEFEKVMGNSQMFCRFLESNAEIQKITRNFGLFRRNHKSYGEIAKVPLLFQKFGRKRKYSLSFEKVTELCEKLRNFEDFYVEIEKVAQHLKISRQKSDTSKDLPALTRVERKNRYPRKASRRRRNSGLRPGAEVTATMSKR